MREGKFRVVWLQKLVVLSCLECTWNTFGWNETSDCEYSGHCSVFDVTRCPKQQMTSSLSRSSAITLDKPSILLHWIPNQSHSLVSVSQNSLMPHSSRRTILPRRIAAIVKNRTIQGSEGLSMLSMSLLCSWCFWDPCLDEVSSLDWVATPSCKLQWGKWKGVHWSWTFWDFVQIHGFSTLGLISTRSRGWIWIWMRSFCGRTYCGWVGWLFDLRRRSHLRFRKSWTGWKCVLLSDQIRDLEASSVSGVGKRT